MIKLEREKFHNISFWMLPLKSLTIVLHISAGMHGGSASAGSEDGQTGEGEVPQNFFLDASIEEIDNSTAHQVRL
ncbi:hypothetical protein EJB05_16162, partial [Eragrostis curvula]